jgi:hypothetical protein
MYSVCVCVCVCVCVWCVCVCVCVYVLFSLLSVTFRLHNMYLCKCVYIYLVTVLWPLLLGWLAVPLLLHLLVAPPLRMLWRLTLVSILIVHRHRSCVGLWVIGNGRVSLVRIVPGGLVVVLPRGLRLLLVEPLHTCTHVNIHT